jgi:HMG (high mobility group) box
MKNTEVSRLLGEMWRAASDDEKRPHVEKEKEEREKYKVAIADWRTDNDLRLEKERKTQAEHAAYVANMYVDPANYHRQQQQQDVGPDPNVIGPLYGRGVELPPSQGQTYVYSNQQTYPYGKKCGMALFLCEVETEFVARGDCSVPSPAAGEPLPIPNERKTTCNPRP